MEGDGRWCKQCWERLGGVMGKLHMNRMEEGVRDAGEVKVYGA